MYESPTIRHRGQVARLRAEVQTHKPQHGEHSGRLRCICSAGLFFVIQSSGLSRAHCTAGCGVRWIE